MIKITTKQKVVAGVAILATAVTTMLLTSPETHYTYLPNIIAGPSKKGLAQAYSGDRLGARWWYVWGIDQAQVGQPGYVPMSRCMEVPDLPSGYSGWLLVGNEPEGPEPYGCPITPVDAVAKVNAIRAAYPDAKLVVGNVRAWSRQWLIKYIALGGTADAWGIHGYVEAWLEVEHITAYWAKAHDYTGGQYWVTETGETHGDPVKAEELVDWINAQNWIDRWAWFTNMAEGTEAWYPADWRVQLVDWTTKELTPLGIMYEAK